jgi:hypothetical protein
MSSSAHPACDAASSPGSVAEYESRRCVICAAKYPGFGFGPPMTRPDLIIWACFAHWKDVESLLSPSGGNLEEVEWCRVRSYSDVARTGPQ